MSILIKGLEMPKGQPIRIVLGPNGKLFVDHGTWFTGYEAIELPDNGDLIDRDAIKVGIWIEDEYKAERDEDQSHPFADSAMMEDEDATD